MKILEGFKTIIFNLAAIGTSWLSGDIIGLPEELKTAITTTIVSAANIALRLVTKTPVGCKSDEEQS